MKLNYVLLLAIACTLGIHYVESLAVMSIDFGTEWMKIGIVSPGVPMEIALNKESKRKTPTVISYRDNDRTFGEDAQTLGIRFPKNSYQYLLDLLGKGINHPIVKLYQERFPYYEIVEDADRGTVAFKHDEDTLYTPEELIAQLLHKGKEFAEQSAHQKIKECVITVPGYFNQVERKALIQAAQLADLKVLQLMNDYMAVALNYGIFRAKDFNETAQYIMFYDMGASSTSAAIVSLQNIKTKERGYVETQPQISVVGVGYDRTLGGLEIQIRLRDFLAKKFNQMKKTSSDVFKNPRSMAKLFKEAGRVKNVLSANADHYAQVEGLLDEQDFRVQVTREDLESLLSDIFDRVGYPVHQALKTAGITVDIISQVVLVGGGTRVPKIQEKLQEIVKQDLAKNVNADEAATFGAVYKAADLSSGFQVKKFITKDAVLFPIQIIFERESENNIKQVKRTLFGLMNPYPQKKIITFNKHVDDFVFNVNYAELDYLRANEVLSIGSTNLTEIALKGVTDALRKNTGDNIESKGIKAHFNMDESGILNLVNVELVVEKTVNQEAEEEGPFSKLGSTISKLFSGETEKETTPDEKSPTEENSPVLEDPELAGSDQDQKSDGKKIPEETTKNETGNANATKEPVNDAPKETKPKVVTLREPLKATETLLTINKMNKKQLEASSEKIKKLNNVEKELNRRASAINNLESFVIEVQNKLYEEEYIEASNEQEIEEIRASCSEVSDWLYEDGSDADTDTYEKKLAGLKTLTRELYMRVYEHRERPDALAALNSMLNGSINFLESARNLTKTNNPDKDVFTDVEINTLDRVIMEVSEWRDKEIEEQNQTKKNEPVKLTVKMITEKMSSLDREVKYLVNKIKLWKPKKVEKQKEDAKKKEESVNTQETESKYTDIENEDGLVETNEEAPETREGEGLDTSKTKSESSGDLHMEL